MSLLFDKIQVKRPNRNVLDLSHDVKLTLNMGNLVPIMCMETIPGDKFNISCESLLRFSPLVSPVMHRMDVTMHYYFVPNRILWDGWEKFITGDPAAPAFPTLQFAGDYPESYPLMDYLGIPSGSDLVDEVVSALPFAAYQCIYNEYYRDQNLIAEVDYKLLNGDNAANQAALLALRRRAWEHDYFTSALPFAQRGAAVDIPLGDVRLKDPWGIDMATGLSRDPHFQGVGGNMPVGPELNQSLNGGEVNVTVVGSPTDKLAYDPDGTLGVEPTTITSLRRAFKLQEWLELAARAGSRYAEQIKAFFDVNSSDKRLQRPEYITGVKSPVVISEVLNTTGTTEAPQGNMAGHAISVTSGQYGNYFCEEHGYIIGIMSVMPKTAYQQGIPKHFLKKDNPYQYFFPQFQHIGEQEIQNRELYAFTADGDETFGYIPRYTEYKFEPNRVAGDFRDSLDFWHLGRKFSSAPALNQAFIECTPAATSRIFAVEDPDQDKLYCQVYNKVKAVRPVALYGNPSM